jgi:hypothetical protein
MEQSVGTGKSSPTARQMQRQAETLVRVKCRGNQDIYFQSQNSISVLFLGIFLSDTSEFHNVY